MMKSVILAIVGIIGGGLAGKYIGIGQTAGALLGILIAEGLGYGMIHPGKLIPSGGGGSGSGIFSFAEGLARLPLAGLMFFILAGITGKLLPTTAAEGFARIDDAGGFGDFLSSPNFDSVAMFWVLFLPLLAGTCIGWAFMNPESVAGLKALWGTMLGLVAFTLLTPVLANATGTAGRAVIRNITGFAVTVAGNTVYADNEHDEKFRVGSEIMEGASQIPRLVVNDLEGIGVQVNAKLNLVHKASKMREVREFRVYDIHKDIELPDGTIVVGFTASTWVNYRSAWRPVIYLTDQYDDYGNRKTLPKELLDFGVLASTWRISNDVDHFARVTHAPKTSPGGVGIMKARLRLVKDKVINKKTWDTVAQ